MSRTMTSRLPDPFDQLRLREQTREQQHRRLVEIGHQWDGTIRSALGRLAQALWPSGHALDRLSIHRVRFRHRVVREAVVWWLERDIPPYDLFRCQAYRVTMKLDTGGGPVLTVESGVGAQAVAPLSKEGLVAALVQAGNNPPLLIPRTRGVARY